MLALWLPPQAGALRPRVGSWPGPGGWRAVSSGQGPHSPHPALPHPSGWSREGSRKVCPGLKQLPQDPGWAPVLSTEPRRGPRPDLGNWTWSVPAPACHSLLPRSSSCHLGPHLRALTLPANNEEAQSQPARGLPSHLLGWEVQRRSHTPSPRKGIVLEFGARSKGGGGTPTRSVRHDQGGLVCLCVFFLFFFFF